MSRKISVTLAENGTSTIIDWSDLDASQIEDCGEAYSYPKQIADPDNQGQFIPNPKPVMAFVISAAMDEINNKRSAIQKARLEAADETTIQQEDIN